MSACIVAMAHASREGIRAALSDLRYRALRKAQGLQAVDHFEVAPVVGAERQPVA
jgi:hypothetical protein